MDIRLAKTLSYDGETATATATLTYDNKNVGTGKTVTASNIALTGSWGTNYELKATTATSTTGKITAKTITGDPLVWNSIVYTLKANDSIELNINFKMAYGELSNGKYRIIKRVLKKEDRPITGRRLQRGKI